MDEQLLNAWREQVVGKKATFSLGRIDPLWSQRYAVAVDDLDPAYFSDQAAREQGYEAMIAPPNYIATLRTEPSAGPVESELLTDGMAPESKPAIEGLQIMGGGQKLEFFAPVYCGEEINCQQMILAINRRESKSGLLIVMEEEFLYANSAGESKLRLINTSLYRMVDSIPAQESTQ